MPHVPALAASERESLRRLSASYNDRVIEPVGDQGGGIGGVGGGNSGDGGGGGGSGNGVWFHAEVVGDQGCGGG